LLNQGFDKALIFTKCIILDNRNLFFIDWQTATKRQKAICTLVICVGLPVGKCENEKV
jgi:hypothetical protein